MEIIKKCTCLFIIAIFLSCSGTDTAEDIIQRHTKVIGGRSDISKVETMIVRATYFYPDTSDEFEALFYWKRPDLTRVEFYREPKQIMAYNGEKAWTASIDPNTGTIINSTELPDSSPLAMNFKRNPGFEAIIGGPPLNYSSMGIKAVLAGIETIDGVRAHNLCLTWPDGFEKKYYFDVENGFFIFEEVKDQRGLIHTSSLSDYKEIGGLFLPCFRLNKGPLINDKRIVVHQKIVELKTNEQLSDSLFARPEKK
jgi:outer membrane lipoprotein-sorting protein